eukprot:scaffold29063_cov67-Skeletonema_dohrnii-CCMP3373.AAC.1
MSKNNTNTNGRVIHSGSGSRQQASKKSNNNNSNNDSNVESLLASGTLRSLTVSAPSRSSTDTINASGFDWVSLVNNGGLSAAANNNNMFGNISNAAAGSNNNNHNNNSVAGIAATSNNQDNDNDSDNRVDHFTIGEKIGMKFVAVTVANDEANSLTPLLITTNPCGNDNGGLPNVIGATSATSDMKDRLIGIQGILRPQPGVSHVIKPNLFFTRTNDGGIPQEKIYYQRQEVNQDETILINGEKFVIPAGYAVEYCDSKILPLTRDQNLKAAYDSQQKSKAMTLVALKDSEVDDSEVDDSEVEDSEVEDSEVEDSEVEDSEVEDSEVEDSEVEDSEVEDSEVEDSEVEDSEVEDSEVEDSEVEDSEVEDSEDGKDDNGTTNYEVLAVLPCYQIIQSVVGKAVKKTFKGMTYFDGDKLKTVDVKVVKYQTEHGHVGRVSVLGTKVLKRPYLVLPSYEKGIGKKNLKARKEESAKYVSL